MWNRGIEFAAALHSSLRLSARPADDFQMLWAGWPVGGGSPLRLGDLVPDGGRPLRAHAGTAGVQDLVDPSDLWTYVILAARRPVGRSHLSTLRDREGCLLLAAAFFLDVRRSQIEQFLTTGPRLALTPPCSRCGLPTGSWCENCRRPLCTRCDDVGATPCCGSCVQ